MSRYIYQKKHWPTFTWDNEHLIVPLGEVRNLQGRLIGSMESLGFDLQSEASLATLTLDIIKTAEIEGEILNPEEVRSSLARRLGMEVSGLIPSDRNVDGVVDMMLDAIQNHKLIISEDRLFGWHSSLFPSGRSGMYKIIVGSYREDSTGPMQVVSGGMGKERVHFQSPSSAKIKKEMTRLFNWLNGENNMDPVLKAGIAHFWFITIHPFEDGNGRIARAITDLLLTRADGVTQRYYSMSAQIQKERKKYYSILETSQKGTLDITIWLGWFLDCLLNALMASKEILEKVFIKHKFWNKYFKEKFNDRQRLMLNKILDGFKEKVTTGKWAKIAKCSNDSALRDIQDLVTRKILKKEVAGGRSTSYDLVPIK